MTDRQVAVLGQKRMEGKTQETAAMAGDERALGKEVAAGTVAVGDEAGAPVAHLSRTLSRACGRRRPSPCCGAITRAG